MFTLSSTEVKSAETVEDDIKGVGKDGSHGAGPWDYVQVSGTDSADIWQRTLSGDRGDVEYLRRVSPPFGHILQRWQHNLWRKRRGNTPRWWQHKNQWDYTQYMRLLGEGRQPLQHR